MTVDDRGEGGGLAYLVRPDDVISGQPLKVAKNILWKGAGGPHLIGNFGEVPLTTTSPKFRMRRGPPAPVQKIFFATLSFEAVFTPETASEKDKTTIGK